MKPAKEAWLVGGAKTDEILVFDRYGILYGLAYHGETFRD